MKTAIEYREWAAKCFAEATAILDAVKDGDDLTVEQRADYDAKMKLYDKGEADAKMMDTHEQRAAHLAASSEKPPTRPIVTGGEEKERAKPWRNIGEQMIAVRHAALYPHEPLDPRLEQQRVATGLGKDTDAEGGFLVGEETSSEIFGRAYNNSELASMCDRTTLGQGVGVLKINAIDETSRADGSRHGGVQAYWEGEGDAATATKPKFRQMKWEPYKLTALYYATKEVMQDADSLSQEAGKAFDDEFAFKLQDAIFGGDGTGKPTGYTASPAYQGVAKEGGQAADTILWENILAMWARVWAPSKARGAFITNQDTFPQLAQMHQVIGTGGVPVWLPPGGAADDPYARLMGRKVIEIEQAAPLGDAKDISFFDGSQFKLVDKGAVEIAFSDHYAFPGAERVFRMIMRVDGKSMWNEVLTPKSGTTNYLSPFVGIAERA